MSSSPLVSVVMSVLNGERFLGEAVESILTQSFRDFEFIIVNDGSTDGTAAILERYEKSDPRVRAYRQENLGMARSLNRGCQLARGKYFARMDADDVAVPTRFASQVEFLERRPEVAVLGGATYLLAKDGPAQHAGLPLEDDRSIRVRLLRTNCMLHSTVMLRTEALRTVGGYRRAFWPAEDYDLWLRISERYQLANLPCPLVYYRMHPGQATMNTIEAQARAGLAARAAAQRRRSGGLDPFDQVEEITPEILASLGVTDRMLADGLAERYAGATLDALAAGYPQHARKLLEQALVACRSHPPSRAVMGELLWQCVKVRMHDREFASALLCALRAYLCNPSLASRPFAYSLRRARASAAARSEHPRA